MKITRGIGFYPSKLLTFPYEIGSYETLPCIEWIYHKDEERLLQMNLYTFPGSTLDGFIFNAGEVLFDGDKLKLNVADVLAYLKENGVQMSGCGGRCSRRTSYNRCDRWKRNRCEIGREVLENS